MNRKNYLLPHYFQKIGWILMVFVLAFGIFDFILAEKIISNDSGTLLPAVFWHYSSDFSTTGFNVSKEYLDNTIFIVCALLSLIFIALSTEKIEDECVGKIRERSLVLSLWFTTFMMIIFSLFVYGFAYFNIMIFNIFAYLLVFIVIFRISIIKFRKENNYQEKL